MEQKTLTMQCPICHATEALDVDLDKWLAWQHGIPIQKAFPGMGADTRERLISGTCPGCFERAFRDDDGDYGVPI